jgi:hypothetical protein
VLNGGDTGESIAGNGRNDLVQPAFPRGGVTVGTVPLVRLTIDDEHPVES